MILEVLVVLVVVFALYGFVGFDQPGDWLKFGAAAAGGSVLAIIGTRWLSDRLISGWLGNGGRGQRGPAAEGLELLRKGDLEGAEQRLRQCLERHPSDGRAAQGLAQIALRRGEAELYMQITSRLLSEQGALRRGERVALCHRQADVCLEHLKDAQRAVEALARIEIDYPGTADALRARRRIERILAPAPGREHEN